MTREMSQKDEDLSAHETARGILSISTKDLVSSVAAVVFFVLIARSLPNVNDLGFLTGLQTLILMFILLSGLGLPNSAARFISTYIGSGKNDRAKNLYPLIFYISIVSSTAFSFVLYSLSAYLAVHLFRGDEYTNLVQLASVDVFLSSMIFTCVFLCYASQQFTRVATFSIVNSVVKFSLAFVLFVVGWGLYGIVIGLIIGDAIGLSLFVIALIPKILIRRYTLFLSASLLELKTLFNFSIPLYGASILAFVTSRVDIYFLMILSTLYAVGIYSPALFMDNTFFLIWIAIDQGLLPVTARIFGKSGLADFKSISKFSSRYLFLFYFPLGIAIAVSAPSLVVMVMGDRFIDSTYPVIIIVVGITLTSPVVIFNNLLRSAGYSGTLLKNEALGVSAQVLMLLVLIPPFGVVGAALAKVLSRVVYLIYPCFKLIRLGAMDYDRSALRNGLAGSFIIGIVIVAMSVFITNQYYYLPITYTISFFVYLLFLRTSHALDRKDIEFFDRIFMGKLKWLTAILVKLLIS
ncbi:MAG: oligosaccharide flippase family protein [Nitrososphaeraceae archaeon]